MLIWNVSLANLMKFSSAFMKQYQIIYYYILHTSLSSLSLILKFELLKVIIVEKFLPCAIIMKI